MARRSKLTPELTESILELLRIGVPDIHACAAVGIAPKTFYEWLKEGEAAKSGKKREFCNSVTRARAEAIQNAVDCLHQGMMPARTKTVSTDKFSETRLNKKGEPYKYTKATEKTQLTESPGDWRAAVEYLKRRDNEHWGDKVDNTVGGKGPGGKIVHTIVDIGMNMDEL